MKPTPPLRERLKLGRNSVDVTPDRVGTTVAVVGAEAFKRPHLVNADDADDKITASPER